MPLVTLNKLGLGAGLLFAPIACPTVGAIMEQRLAGTGEVMSAPIERKVAP